MLLVFSSSIFISNAKAFYIGRLLSLLQFSEWKRSGSEMGHEFKAATVRTRDSVFKTLSVQDYAHKIHFNTFENSRDFIIKQGPTRFYAEVVTECHFFLRIQFCSLKW